MKKIFIEDGLTLYNKTGIGQYTQNLHDILKDSGYEVIMPRKYLLEKISNATIKRIVYNIWLNLIFPLMFIFSGAENAIFTNHLTPLYKIPTKKYYPVIHDLWALKFPETMSKTKQKYQTWILNVIKNTYYKIITVSNTVKAEIIKYYNCDENNICIVYNYFSFGEEPRAEYSQLEQNELLKSLNIKEKEFILSVGSLNKRKNIQTLINAYNAINTDKKLVIVGRQENQEFSEKNQNIIFTGYINDEKLKALYKNAMIFVFPSIYEGFGIPLIDAQSFGIPVLCSDIPVFREVGGKSVEFCNTNYESIAEKLQQLLNNTNRQEELIQKGTENIKKYSVSIIENQIKSILSNN